MAETGNKRQSFKQWIYLIGLMRGFDRQRGGQDGIGIGSPIVSISKDEIARIHAMGALAHHESAQKSALRSNCRIRG